jgi:hypothetical protein
MGRCYCLTAFLESVGVYAMTGAFGSRLSRRFVTFALIVTAWAITVPTWAELLVYEPFDYPASSPLLGKNGGSGFTTPWESRTPPTAGASTIQSGSLSYSNLPTSGNSVLMSGMSGIEQIFRSHVNIVGADASTTWISFIGQRLGPETTSANPYPRGVNISFYNTEGFAVHGREQFAIGNSTNAATNNWAFIPHGVPANVLPTDNPPVQYGGGPPVFVVLRIDHHGPPNIDGPGNNDDFYLFINPSLASEPSPATANVKRLGTESNSFDYAGLDYFRPFVGNTAGGGTQPYGELLWDELRIGTTWSDAIGGSFTPVLPGDTDGDGNPGEFPDDFEPIRANFRNAVALRNEGDLVPNGVVDFDDFRQWKAAFLAGGGSLAGVDISFGTGVPEPAGGAIALLAFTFILAPPTRFRRA